MQLLPGSERRPNYGSGILVKLAKLRKADSMTFCGIPPLRAWECAMPPCQAEALRFEAGGDGFALTGFS